MPPRRQHSKSAKRSPEARANRHAADAATAIGGAIVRLSEDELIHQIVARENDPSPLLLLVLALLRHLLLLLERSVLISRSTAFVSSVMTRSAGMVCIL